MSSWERSRGRMPQAQAARWIRYLPLLSVGLVACTQSSQHTSAEAPNTAAFLAQFQTVASSSGATLPKGVQAEHAPIRLVPKSLSPKFVRDSGFVRAEVGGHMPQTATLKLPVSAAHAFELRSIVERTGAPATSSLSVRIVGAAESAKFQEIEGYAVYPAALGRGFDIAHRVTQDGTEDYLTLPSRLPGDTLSYDLSLQEGIAGLRLVGGTLEMLDANGTPVFRVAAPVGYDAQQKSFEAVLAVEGCHVDTNPAAPWGRAVTPPGAANCKVHVRWNGAAIAYPAVLDPAWTTTGNLGTARARPGTVLLSNGRVLVAGGTDTGAPFPATKYKTAELYDVATGTWAATGSLNGAAYQYPILTVLNDGRVLSAGETNSLFGGDTGNVGRLETYNPTTGVWTQNATMHWNRTRTRSVKLSNGKVLIVGGGTNDPSQADQFASKTSEIFDPATNTVSDGPSLVAPVDNQVMVTLANGKTFVGAVNNTPQLFDPNTNTFSATGSWVPSYMSVFEGCGSALLSDGRVLVITGGDNGAGNPITSTIYNPATGTFSQTTGAPPASASTETNNGLGQGVANGDAYFISGSNSAMLWNHTTGTWSQPDAMATPHSGGALVALPDGRLLAVGGADAANNATKITEFFGCTANADCAAGRFAADPTLKPFCDTTAGPNKGLCRACNGDNGSGAARECGTGTPACNTTGPLTGACTVCGPSNTSKCTGATPSCDTTTGTCAGCNGDKGSGATRACTATAAPACNTAGALSGTCSECTASNKALCTGAKAFCNTTSGACTGCDGDNGSGSAYACPTTAAPACVAGTCKACSATNKTACTGASPVCNTTSNTCVACNGDNGAATSAVCPTTAAPFCKADGSCQKCTDGGNGATGCTNGTPAHVGPYCNATSGSCGTNCMLDAQCTGQWCKTDTGACNAKLANGTAIPTVTGRNTPDPALSGTCTAAVGAALCAGGVCSTADNKCGYNDGEGPCNTGNAATVCRSGLCSAAGTCVAAGACTVDADCPGAWCDMTAKVCKPKVANGSAVPTDATHTSPALNGMCTTAAATLTCVTAICDNADNLCGLKNGTSCTLGQDAQCRSELCFGDSKCGIPDGEGPCTAANGPTICRSGKCGGDGKCAPATGCNVDADCTGTEWCNISEHLCKARVPNGSAVPTDTAHVTPKLDGNCTEDAAALACLTGACDTADALCGIKNGNPCVTGKDAQCRAALCFSDGKCGVPDGQGPCTAANAAQLCRSGSCGSDGKCGNGATGCDTDADCTGATWCNISTRSCKPRAANGQPLPGDAAHTSPVLDGKCTPASGALVCFTGVCDTSDNLCGLANASPCTVGQDAQCRAAVCFAADSKCGKPDGQSCSDALECRAGVCNEGSCGVRGVPVGGGLAGGGVDWDCSTTSSGNPVLPNALLLLLVAGASAARKLRDRLKQAA